MVVDDHVLYRRGLEAVLSHEDDITVVGEAGDGVEAVDRLDTARPDVVLLDLRMPKSDGVTACAAIRAAAPNVRVIMLAATEDGDDLLASLRAGAHGYLTKESPGETVVAGIRAVAQGEALVHPLLVATLLEEFHTVSRREPSPISSDGAGARLTDREVQVVELISQGRSNRDIAAELFISENTVKNHVRSILDKLSLRSRTEVAMYAVRERLVPGL